MRKIVLETNAVSSLFGGDTEVFQAISSAENIYLPIFVMGELIAGFKAGKREKENREILNRLISKPSVKVVQTTMETAEIFADIKNNLKNIGNPIPINDVWISAQTFETGSVLVTYDKHFRSVPGLRIW